MKLLATILIGCLSAFNARLANAQPQTMTELVPRVASYSLVFRHVNELKERGDEFATEMGHKGAMSWFCRMAGSELLVQGAADDTLPCGIMFFEPELIGEPPVKQGWKKPVAVKIGISDTRVLAKSLEVDHEEFVTGKVVSKGHSTFGHTQRFYRMADQYLWVTSHEKIYDVLKTAEPLTTVIPRSRLDEINAQDLLMSFSAESRDLQREACQERADKWIKSLGELDPAEEHALRELHSLIFSASHAVLTGRVDRGLEFSFNLFFGQDAPAEVQQRMVRFSPPAEGVSLAGLPSGKLLFGHAARTDASLVQPAMVALVREMRGEWWGVWREMLSLNLISQFEQLEILGLFGEIWPLTERYKVGIYQEELDAASGLISMAAIFQTEQPDKLMNEIQSLAALVDRSAFGSTDNEDDRKKTQAIVRDLITQLADDDFEKRQSATTRLVLIGEPALPLVIDAKSSDAAAVAHRAVQIEKLIREKLQEQQKAALEQSLLAKAKPVFIFHPEAEKREGRTVDIMEVRLSATSEMQTPMAITAGKEWSRIRFVKFEKHVVVYFGSNFERLNETIRNVQAMEQGDAVPAPETPYGSPLLRNRGAEIQGSLTRIQRLIKFQQLTEEELSKQTDPDLSSVSVTIEPDFFSAEWRLSLPDLKTAGKGRF
tara:strand:- start:49319 stop:51292 length:1974 start_codon:yes stop_codon:yes gene_type:complete